MPRSCHQSAASRATGRTQAPSADWDSRHPDRASQKLFARRRCKAEIRLRRTWLPENATSPDRARRTLTDYCPSPSTALLVHSPPLGISNTHPRDLRSLQSGAELSALRGYSSSRRKTRENRPAISNRPLLTFSTSRHHRAEKGL